MARIMRRLLLVAASAPLWLFACAADGDSILDRELSAYRYEQEAWRAAELDELYEAEKARCAELTAEILRLREEAASLEALGAELRARVAAAEAAAAAAAEKLEATSQ